MWRTLPSCLNMTACVHPERLFINFWTGAGTSHQGPSPLVEFQNGDRPLKSPPPAAARALTTSTPSGPPIGNQRTMGQLIGYSPPSVWMGVPRSAGLHPSAVRRG